VDAAQKSCCSGDGAGDNHHVDLLLWLRDGDRLRSLEGRCFGEEQRRCPYRDGRFDPRAEKTIFARRHVVGAWAKPRIPRTQPDRRKAASRVAISWRFILCLDACEDTRCAVPAAPCRCNP
jgi:hypothetical protein